MTLAHVPVMEFRSWPLRACFQAGTGLVGPAPGCLADRRRTVRRMSWRGLLTGLSRTPWKRDGQQQTVGVNCPVTPRVDRPRPLASRRARGGWQQLGLLGYSERPDGVISRSNQAMNTCLKLILPTLLLAPFASAASEPASAPSNGIPYPEGWKNWSTIAVSHRTDNGTIRVILGNEAAVEAARALDTAPWPDGAILGKVVWKASALENWPAAMAPGQFVHAEFMFKDSESFAESGGWGWARWVGAEQVPFNEGMQVCTSCHTPVADRDWVFTEPAQWPR